MLGIGGAGATAILATLWSQSGKTATRSDCRKAVDEPAAAVRRASQLCCSCCAGWASPVPLR